MRMQLNGPQIPGVFKAWFAVCAVVALGTLALVGWAVVKIVTHFCG